ncbi:MAG: DUF4783 domain-containing protein [Bacteroidales bacterium]|nr:DUF4783 domain-containing protein [Bacteroidales bacterium]MCF8337159.1 DUF4783 domain-containing protein [Bacteroidales bacterium]
MKNFLFISGLILVLSTSAQGQAFKGEPENMIDSIMVCFETHDAKKIIQHMNDPIDLKINDKKGIYSHSQAEILISDFFRDYPVSSLSKNHVEQSGKNEVFIIGTYKSSGESFRVYFLLKKNGEGYKIYQFYIEKS